MRIETNRDQWIVGQLAGIRMLERELAEAFRSPGAGSGVELQRRVAKLNSWVNLVDDALTVGACSTSTPSRLRRRAPAA